jgi:hypothetical protein
MLCGLCGVVVCRRKRNGSEGGFGEGRKRVMKDSCICVYSLYLF